jgi:hypothetical protein
MTTLEIVLIAFSAWLLFVNHHLSKKLIKAGFYIDILSKATTSLLEEIKNRKDE